MNQARRHDPKHGTETFARATARAESLLSQAMGNAEKWQLRAPPPSILENARFFLIESIVANLNPSRVEVSEGGDLGITFRSAGQEVYIEFVDSDLILIMEAGIGTLSSSRLLKLISLALEISDSDQGMERNS